MGRNGRPAPADHGRHSAGVTEGMGRSAAGASGPGTDTAPADPVRSAESSTHPRRGRPQAARLSPERLAAARGGVREGVAWLGRPPETHASPLVRIVAALARALLLGILRFRVDRSGAEHLPPGGYLLVGAVHRGWMDPFLILASVPLEPRVWFLGSGPSAFDRRWKEALLHRLGGMLPVWRGGVGIATHVESARAVLDRGGVFVLLPEGGVTGPPDELAPFRFGAAVIALRTGAPIVPFVMVGSQELYLGKRFATRILPATSAAELLGDAWDGVLPGPDSGAEIDLAKRLTERFAAILGPEVTALYPGTVDPPGRPRRLRGLTRLLLPARR
jgi:1-acyl-sn-glycerol-3-phosphate acyltransferase